MTGEDDAVVVVDDCTGLPVWWGGGEEVLRRTSGWYGPNPYDLGVPLPSTSAVRVVAAADGTLVTPDHLCPDLLRYQNLGEADGTRGRMVRAFFWMMRAWPVRP